MIRSTQADRNRQRSARERLLSRILARATSDARVLAVLDYGSTSEGRGDAWSDIDLALSVRPDDWDDFNATWKSWLADCGPLLLGFISFVGHPWAVIDTEEAPVRVDLHLYGGPPDEDLREGLRTWPNAPTSTDAMLLLDRENTLVSDVASMVGRSLAPADVSETFTNVAAHFWYYVHRTWSKMHRTSDWDIRWSITVVLTGNLCSLLRLESGAVERWSASDAASGIEHAISPARLEQLNRCVPSASPGSLLPAFSAMIDLGIDVFESLSDQHRVPWSDDLAAQMRTMVS